MRRVNSMISLSRREKLLLKALGALVALLALVFLVIMPFIEYRGRSETATRKYSSDIQKLEALYEEYREIKQRKSRYASLLSMKNDNVTTLVEQWAANSGVSRNIAYASRTQSTIQNRYVRITTDIKFESVPIQNLLRFIYEVENSNRLININYFRVYQGLKGADTYDAIMKIDSFTLQ